MPMLALLRAKSALINQVNTLFTAELLTRLRESAVVFFSPMLSKPDKESAFTEEELSGISHFETSIQEGVLDKLIKIEELKQNILNTNSLLDLIAIIQRLEKKCTILANKLLQREIFNEQKNLIDQKEKLSRTMKLDKLIVSLHAQLLPFVDDIIQ